MSSKALFLGYEIIMFRKNTVDVVCKRASSVSLLSTCQSQSNKGGDSTKEGITCRFLQLLSCCEFVIKF